MHSLSITYLLLCFNPFQGTRERMLSEYSLPIPTRNYCGKQVSCVDFLQDHCLTCWILRLPNFQFLEQAQSLNSVWTLPLKMSNLHFLSSIGCLWRSVFFVVEGIIKGCFIHDTFIQLMCHASHEYLLLNSCKMTAYWICLLINVRLNKITSYYLQGSCHVVPISIFVVLDITYVLLPICWIR